MTSRTAVRMRSCRGGVCGNNAVQFQSYDDSSYCTALRENGWTDIVSRQLRDSSIIRRWCGNSLKAQSMCSTKAVVSDLPWWRPVLMSSVCGKLFCRTGASQFRNSLVSYPRCLAYCFTKSSFDGRKTFSQRRWSIVHRSEECKCRMREARGNQMSHFKFHSLLQEQS